MRNKFIKRIITSILVMTLIVGPVSYVNVELTPVKAAENETSAQGEGNNSAIDFSGLSYAAHTIASAMFKSVREKEEAAVLGSVDMTVYEVVNSDISILNEELSNIQKQMKNLREIVLKLHTGVTDMVAQLKEEESAKALQDAESELENFISDYGVFANSEEATGVWKAYEEYAAAMKVYVSEISSLSVISEAFTYDTQEELVDAFIQLSTRYAKRADVIVKLEEQMILEEELAEKTENLETIKQSEDRIQSQEEEVTMSGEEAAPLEEEAITSEEEATISEEEGTTSDGEMSESEAEIAALEEEIAVLKEKLTILETEIATLEEEIISLEGKVAKNGSLKERAYDNKTYQAEDARKLVKIMKDINVVKGSYAEVEVAKDMFMAQVECVCGATEAEAEALMNLKKSKRMWIEQGAILEKKKLSLSEQMWENEGNEEKIEQYEQEIAKIEEQIEAIEANIVEVEKEIVYMETEMAEMVNAAFSEDMNQLNALIEKYLASTEQLLRESTPFEHMITDTMKKMFEGCFGVQVQMLSIYSEYYDSLDHIDSNQISRIYTATDLAETATTQLENSGITKFMVAEQVEAKEYHVYAAYDEKGNGIGEPIDTLDAPECIEITTTIGGESCECYKVRDNRDGSYYIIAKDTVPIKELVSKVKDGQKTVYKPEGLWDIESIEDAQGMQYGLITAMDDMPCAEEWNNVLAQLTEYVGDEIDQKAEYILFNSSPYANDKDETYWEMCFHGAHMSADTEEIIKTSKEVIDEEEEALLIYKSGLSGVDKPDAETFVVGDGDELNISNLTKEATIYVNGSATIVGDASVTKKARIVIQQNGDVTLRNVNIKAYEQNESAIEVEKNIQCKIQLEGTNTFSGCKYSEVDTQAWNEDLERKEGMLVTSGMEIKEGAKVTVTQGSNGNENMSSTFMGYGTGAGICTQGDLDMQNAGKIIAKNESVHMQKDEKDYHEWWGFAAGIGVGTYGDCHDHYGESDEDIQKRAYGNQGTIHITGTEVIATSGIPRTGERMCCDIGGVVLFDVHGPMTNPGNFLKLGYLVEETLISIPSGCEISNSKITATNYMIDSSIKQHGNTYGKDNYCVTLDTTDWGSITSAWSTPDLYVNVGLTGSQGTSDVAKVCMPKVYHANSAAEGETYYELEQEGIITGNLILNDTSPGEAITEVILEGNCTAHKISGYSTVSGEKFEIYVGKKLSDTAVSTKTSDVVYKVEIKTADQKNAGSNSDVELELIDENGETTGVKKVEEYSDLMSSNKLSNVPMAYVKSESLEKGQVDTLYIAAEEGMGKITNVRIKSDHSGAAPGWKMESIKVQEVQGGDDGFTITPNQWFVDNQYKNFGRYSEHTGAFKVTVHTANQSNAGTDSSIKVRIKGSEGETGWMDFEDYCINSSKNNFEKNSTDTAIFTYDVFGIGEIEAVELDHNGKYAASGWLPEYITVTEIVADGEYVQSKMAANTDLEWMDDEKKEFVLSSNPSYKVSMKTANEKNAGTNSKVTLQLVDENGKTSEEITINDMSDQSDSFEKGCTDVFCVQPKEELGKITNVKIKSDDSGAASGWKMESVTVEELQGDRDSFTITPNQWFVDNQYKNFGRYSGHTGAFKVTVHTANKSNAGTDSSIKVQLKGSEGETGWLDFEDYCVDSSKNNFEKNSTDTAIFTYNVSGIGDIESIEFDHNGKYAASGWLPEYITVTEIAANGEKVQSKTATNADMEWIDDEKKEFTFSNAPLYRVSIKTANEKNAGTNSKITLQLIDEKGKESQKVNVGNLSDQDDPFEKGQTDIFCIQPEENLGKITNVKIQSDHSEASAGWKMESIQVEQILGGSDSFTITPNQWFSDETSKTFGRYSKKTGSFEVTVHTANEKNSGTDSTIKVRIHGSEKTTEWMDFENYCTDSSKNNFEKNNTDTAMFTYDVIGVGEINKIEFSHNGKHAGSGWLPDKITVKEIAANGEEVQIKTGTNSDWIDKEEKVIELK